MLLGSGDAVSPAIHSIHVEHGETVCITRDGRGVAELRPLEHPRFTLPVVLARFKRLPRMDLDSLREDFDDVLDMSI
jgi:antitoxin (DNA-binding transcriptional repressor) of toxin-antitoxin stability system